MKSNPFEKLGAALSDKTLRYFAEMSEEYSRISDIRRRSGFTIMEAQKHVPLSKPALEHKFKKAGLKSELCYDPGTRKVTRFYFPK